MDGCLVDHCDPGVEPRSHDSMRSRHSHPANRLTYAGGQRRPVSYREKPSSCTVKSLSQLESSKRGVIEIIAQDKIIYESCPTKEKTERTCVASVSESCIMQYNPISEHSCCDCLSEHCADWLNNGRGQLNVDCFGFTIVLTVLKLTAQDDNFVQYPLRCAIIIHE